MVQFSNFDRLRVMGARDHFTCASRSASKKGASSKSQTSRINKLKVGLVSTFILFSFSLNAQNEKASTLFSKNKEHKIDPYGALETKFSQMDNRLGLFLGGRLGAVLNNSFSFGAAGYGLLPTAKLSFDCPVPNHETEKNDYWSSGYGGLFFEYINSPNRVVHFSANTLVGCGRVTYKNINSFFSSQKNYYADKITFEHPSSFVFILEPGVELNLNMTKFFKVSFGVSYRYAPNFKLKYEEELVPSTFFNGFSANLVFKFAEF